jgi:RES domain-containing protein
MRVWRITSKRRINNAFSGDGARQYGGRWNRKGIPVVYTAESPALAMLEMLVQDEPLRAKYMIFPVDIPDRLHIDFIEIKQLPKNWIDPEQIESLRELGSNWALSKKSPVLAVPSAVIPIETNYLLNPLHNDFYLIKIGKPLTFFTDRRLLKE